MSINWDHPQVEKLILDKFYDRPDALTHLQIAEAVSKILKRNIQPTNIQRRLGTLKKKLEKNEDIVESAKNTKNPLKEKKAIKDMSNQSLLAEAMEKMEAAMAMMNELKNRLDAEPANNDCVESTNNECTEEYSEQLNTILASCEATDNAMYATDDVPSCEATDATTYSEIQPQENESEHYQIVEYKEGLNSKLNTCLIVEDQEHCYEYSFSFERNGIKYYTCAQCRSGGNKASYMKITSDGIARAGYHHEHCKPRTCTEAEILQADRRGRFAALKGETAYDSYIATYENLKDSKLDVHHKPYSHYRRQLGRWRRKNRLATTAQLELENHSATSQIEFEPIDLSFLRKL